MERKRYIADSKDPKKMRAPVRKRLPVEADWKLNEDLGRWRFRSSKLRSTKNERRSSRFSEEICSRDEVITGVFRVYEAGMLDYVPLSISYGCLLLLKATRDVLHRYWRGDGG